MKIMEKIKAVEPVANWRYWYRKWSFWFIGMIPVITAARESFPELKDFIGPEPYKWGMCTLAVVAFIASQIKQRAIEVPPNPADPEDQK